MENKVMTIGIVGAGMISKTYIGNIQERFPEIKIKSICANHFEHAQSRAEEYGLTATTFEEMLKDPEIELILNITTLESHYEISKAALLAGKHVYSEKTIARTADEARELLELADSKELYLGCAPDTFLGAAFECGKEFIDSGKLGTVTSFSMAGNRDNNFFMSWFPFLRKPGAGTLNDYCVYYITALVSLLGKAKSVAAFVRNPYPEHHVIKPDAPDFGKTVSTPNESEVIGIINLESGVSGTFHMNQDSLLFDESYFAIYGTKGILYLPCPNDFDGPVYFLENNWDSIFKGENKKQLIEHTGKYTVESRGAGLADMVHAIWEDREPRASKEQAENVLNILNGFVKSSEEHIIVDL